MQVLHPYLLGLLAMIKCSICSYQCDNWYVSNWRLACHIYFSLGRSPLELAQGLSRVALALHIAGRSTPFGVTWVKSFEVLFKFAAPRALPRVCCAMCTCSLPMRGSSYANVSTFLVETTCLLGCDRRYAYTAWSVPRRVRWYYSGLQTPSKLRACSRFGSLIRTSPKEWFFFPPAPARWILWKERSNAGAREHITKKLFTLLDLCVSSLRRGHANLLCIVPILTDDPRRESFYEYYIIY